MKKTRELFKQVKQDAYDIVNEQENRPRKIESALSFFGNARYAFSLVLKEKEIILFAFMQMFVVMVGYLLWVQILDLIPDEVWESAKDSSNNGGSIADLVLFVWSFVCVGLVSFPLGLLTGCMGAAHFLHKQGKESTVTKCLEIVMSRSGPIWVYSWIDGWWTVMRIVERLPKKNDKVSFGQKLRNEAIYQAWKLASLGILPALIIGRGTIDACKDSLGLVKDRFTEMVKLRAGYSIICWIFGISAYVLMIFIYPYVKNYMQNDNDMYTFYMFAGVPLMFALLFIHLIFRPIYIISACNIYSDYVTEKNIKIDLKVPDKSNTILVFIFLMLLTFIGYEFRNELGISEMLATPYTSIQNKIK